ncbi:PH domain-containing protein [uncultured Eubacterium sp.]|uniref:PH domain-containing protein n=1 Tax=uncultured Eubacterium sp. TaxID=165185 RepID=UPI002670F1A4|nr:PH domain-containing protein [uncultured Eubacterium sp.]
MYEKLSKNALANMYLGTITGIVIALVVIFLLEILLVIPNHIGIAVILGIVLAVVLALNALISPIIRFYRYRYKIDDESIDIIEGYIFVTRSIVPINRLHKLEIIQGPYDKICNVAKVNVTTAGGDVTIRFLETEKADKITESLKKKINEIAIEQNKQSNS